MSFDRPVHWEIQTISQKKLLVLAKLLDPHEADATPRECEWMPCHSMLEKKNKILVWEPKTQGDGPAVRIEPLDRRHVRNGRTQIS